MAKYVRTLYTCHHHYIFKSIQLILQGSLCLLQFITIHCSSSTTIPVAHSTVYTSPNFVRQNALRCNLREPSYFSKFPEEHSHRPSREHAIIA